jgi:endonuclease/exonuclease/phosphatase family metal-dependent hydrolase
MLVAATALLCMRGAVAAPAPARLLLATWNMEWLVDPRTALAARIACRDGGEAALSCDVALGLARDSADVAALARHARRLGADVIAFQEVQDEAIARRVFRGYRICMNGGPGMQHVGFALRPGLAHDCGEPFAALAVGGQGRAGLQLRIHVPQLGAIELLAVHLKSGCAHDPLDSSTEACRLLSAQARVLGEWIGARSRAGTPFIVLGDFNRGGMPGAADAFWSQLGPEFFHASALSLPFANCSWGAPYRDFIDHILVSASLGGALPAKAFSQLRFRQADAVRYRLPDHCPLGVSLNARRDL